MELLPFSLVLISIFTHAYWNYLIKSSENKHVFTCLSKVAEVVIFAIPASYFAITLEFHSEYWLFIVVAAIVTFMNYFFLASAYKYGELSLIYPVSRSSIIFLPFIAFFSIGETIDSVGYLAIILILIGTFLMHMESIDRPGIKTIFKNMNTKGTLYALLAALMVAGYTLWDKIAITRLEPFLYFYLYTCMVGIIYSVIISVRFKREEIRKEWQLNRNRIVQVGFFNSLTYILVLTALTMSKVSYVGGLRQLSIVVGAFLGVKFLGEKFGEPKLVGILISILGGCLIYLAG